MKNGTLWKRKKILLSISVSHPMEDILTPENEMKYDVPCLQTNFTSYIVLVCKNVHRNIIDAIRNFNFKW